MAPLAPRIHHPRGILARESSISHGGIGSPLPIARRITQGMCKVYDFAYKCALWNFFLYMFRFKLNSFVKESGQSTYVHEIFMQRVNRDREIKILKRRAKKRCLH